MKHAWLYLLLPIGGALLLYLLAWPDPPPPYPDVIVVPHVIESQEPDTTRSLGDRIRNVRPQPERTATAPRGAVGDVDAFCAAAAAALEERVPEPRMELVPSPAPAPEISAAPAAPPRLFLRSVVHRPGPIWNPFAQDRLFLSEVVSTGDLRGEDFRIRDGFSARAHGDSVIVRYPRFGLLRTAGEVAVIGGAAIALHELGVFRVVWDLLPF